MTLPRRRCSAFDATGEKRCNTIGPCTHVRQWKRRPWVDVSFGICGLVGTLPWTNTPPELQYERWVCPMCRKRMRLPDHDVDFEPGVVEISDHIVEPEHTPFALP